jgi:thymidylate kinase
MAEHDEISQLITAVFAAWQQAGINFLILRNYEELPHFTTNDIDVLVPKDQRVAAEKTLVSTAAASGFRLLNRAEFATLALYFSHTQTGAQTHFDLFTALKWRGFDFLPAEDFLAKKIPHGSFFIPHPAHEAVANLLASFIFNGRVKDKYRARIADVFRADPDTARALMAKSYSEVMADKFVKFGARENWAAIEAELSDAREMLIWRQSMEHPLRTFISLDADCDRLVKRMFRPPGLVVVLCGPDGCGKSTVAPKLVEALSGVFSPPKGRQIHWKPRVFSRSRENSGPETNPHGKPARKKFASLMYFAFHWLEFFLGWWLRVFPATFKGGLVMIDRYYFDFFVDQKRYRMQVPQSIIEFGYRLLPKPDLVFLLDTPADVLQQRKKEVPADESARQRTAFVELMKRVKNGAVIDATQSPEAITAEIQKAVLDFMAKRTAKRNG